MAGSGCVCVFLCLLCDQTAFYFITDVGFYGNIIDLEKQLSSNFLCMFGMPHTDIHTYTLTQYYLDSAWQTVT